MRLELDEALWMSLGNMRTHRVRNVVARCRCGHAASVNVDMLPDEAKVPALCRRLRCSRCGKRPYSTEPDWPTRAEAEASRS